MKFDSKWGYQVSGFSFASEQDAKLYHDSSLVYDKVADREKLSPEKRAEDKRTMANFFGAREIPVIEQ